MKSLQQIKIDEDKEQKRHAKKVSGLAYLLAMHKVVSAARAFVNEDGNGVRVRNFRLLNDALVELDKLS